MNLQSVFVAPRTDVEELLADIFAEVLQVEKVTVLRRTFFTSAANHRRRFKSFRVYCDLFQVEVPLRLFILEAPTVIEFCRSPA